MAIKKVSTNAGGKSTTLKTPTIINRTKSFSEVVQELLAAHHKARKTVLLYGNSGYGKSATIESYCKNNSIKLEKIFCITLDPLTSSMPVEKGDMMRFIPNEQLHRLCTTTEPTVVLYDETNKFSNPSVENMLNSIFLDREYNGHKFSDSVLVVGCMNFVSKSGSAQELDFSIINRATNILFAPSVADIKTNMQTKMGKLLTDVLPLKCSGVVEFKTEVLDRLHGEDDETSPRQIDDIACILQANPDLSDQAIELLCIGRLGSKKGKMAAHHIIKNRDLVDVLNTSTTDKVVDLFNKGERQSVIHLLEECVDFDAGLYVVEKTKSPQLAATLVKNFGNNYMVGNTPLLMFLVDKGLLKFGD